METSIGQIFQRKSYHQHQQHRNIMNGKEAREEFDKKQREIEEKKIK
jgi:hypothetical protein